MNTNLKGPIYVIIAALIYATSGILIKFLGEELSVFAQVYYRMIVSLIIITLMVIIKKKSIKIKNKDIPKFLISAGVGYVAMIVLFTIAVLTTTVANAFWLLYLTPIFVIILSAIFLKEKIISRHVAGFIIMAAGLYAVFLPTLGRSFGELAAIGSAVCYATYVIINKQTSQKYGADVSLFYTLLFSVGIMTLSLVYFYRDLTLNVSLHTIGFIILFGIVNFLGAYLLNTGLKNTSAQSASILLVFEPVGSIIYAWIFFNEVLTMMHYIGFSLIFIAVIIATYQKTVKKKTAITKTVKMAKRRAREIVIRIILPSITIERKRKSV